MTISRPWSGAPCTISPHGVRKMGICPKLHRRSCLMIKAGCQSLGTHCGIMHWNLTVLTRSTCTGTWSQWTHVVTWNLDRALWHQLHLSLTGWLHHREGLVGGASSVKPLSQNTGDSRYCYGNHSNNDLRSTIRSWRAPVSRPRSYRKPVEGAGASRCSSSQENKRI